jgi:hypothetical protein
MDVDAEGFRRAFGFDIDRATGAELHAYFLNGARGVEGFGNRFLGGGSGSGARLAGEAGASGTEVSFRLSAGSRVEAMRNRLDAALARDPEERRRIGRRANEKLQALQFNSETMRFTGKGGAIRPLVEKRTAAELDKEQAARQALRAEELLAEEMAKLTPEALMALESGGRKFSEGFLASAILGEVGRLMSKTQAAKLGLDNAQGRE